MPIQQKSQVPFDVAILGAGIVGCAMARRMTLDGARTVVIEKAPDVLAGASKANSAILHTGFDAPPDSLEHACIREGYAEYLVLAEALGLPILKSGALVLAWTEDQLAGLPALVDKAHKNGVSDVRLLTRSEILGREPKLSESVLGGFEVPREYLIDPWTSGHAYIMQALENGATLLRDSEVTSGSFHNGLWTITAGNQTITARHVINCAGLYGDKVDHLLLGESGYTIKPRKGQFVVFDKVASKQASSIILPVPTKKTKGIVVCRTIFGNLLVGPTAEDQESREDASTQRDTLKALHEAGIQMLPELAGCEVTTAYAGLRPATERPEYRINVYSDRNYVSVGGIRSTGLSAALGIAKHVAGKLGPAACTMPAIANPKKPRLDRLSNYHTRDWQENGNGGVVCHCELVTRREIEAALDSSMPPNSLAGLKRRTRVTMGRCQGFYCSAELAEMTKGKLTHPMINLAEEDDDA